jgi:hypothetical protein|nr:MAG TPA: hypothetical protein [Bacteriophage sp.]
MVRVYESEELNVEIRGIMDANAFVLAKLRIDWDIYR